MLKNSLVNSLQRIKEREDTLVLRPELLLGPNIPTPMHGVAPRVVLGQAWWDRERRVAYKSTNFRCLACGVHKSVAKYRQWLEAHEEFEVDYAKGKMKYLRAVPLCHFCHNYIHQGRLNTLLQKGEIHHAKYVAIVQHGDSVLLQAGLDPRKQKERDEEIEQAVLRGDVCEWGKWRLWIGSRRFPPKYPTIEAWRESQGKKEIAD